MKALITILFLSLRLVCKAQIEKQAKVAPFLKKNIPGAITVQLKPNNSYYVMLTATTGRNATVGEILSAAKQKRISEVYAQGRDILAAKYPIWERDLILSEAVKDKTLFDAIVAYEKSLKAVYDAAVISINAASTESAVDAIVITWP